MTTSTTTSSRALEKFGPPSSLHRATSRNIAAQGRVHQSLELMANLTTPGHVTSSRPANSSAEEPEASSAGADGSWASTSDSHTQHELPRLHFGPFPYKVVLAYYIFLWLLNCVFPIVMYYPLQGR